jgi:hypothetical protein
VGIACFNLPPLLSSSFYLFIFLLYFYDEGPYTYTIVMVLFSMKRETRR